MYCLNTAEIGLSTLYVALVWSKGWEEELYSYLQGRDSRVTGHGGVDG